MQLDLGAITKGFITDQVAEVLNVMEVRGYQSGKMRSTFRQLKWKNQDTICLLLMVVLTIGLAILRAPGGLH
jgi:energy-coupling factor transport system permease protein